MAPMNIQTVSCQTNRLFAFCHTVSLISDQLQPHRGWAAPQLGSLWPDWRNQEENRNHKFLSVSNGRGHNLKQTFLRKWLF